MIVISFLFYLLACILLVYLPGRWILRKTTIKLSHKSQIVACSIAIGLCIFLVGTYLLSWIDLAILYYLASFFIAIRELPRSFHELRNIGRLNNGDKLLTGIILTGTFLMTYLTARSGIWHRDRVEFYGINHMDSLFHIGLIGSLARSFPPEHFGLADVPFRGYHFFYDFFISQFVSVFQLSPFDLYLRFTPILLGLFLGVASIAFARAMGAKNGALVFFVSFIYFAQDLTFYFDTLFGKKFLIHMPQSIDHILDPSVLLATALVFSLIPLLFNKKKNFLLIIIIGIIIGSLSMVKVYMALLVFAGMGVIIVYEMILKRERTFIPVMVIASITAMIVYLPINFGAGSFVFAPFLYFRHLMEGSPYFQSLAWPVQYQIFENNNNILRIGILQTVIISSFFIQVLGVRLMSLLLIPRILRRSWITLPHVFLSTMVIIGLLIPIFFIQSVSIFNTVQFFWIVFILLLYPTALAFSQYFEKRSRIGKILLLALLIGLFLPGTLKDVVAYSQKPFTIDKYLIGVTDFMRTHIPENESILILNREPINNSSHNLYANPFFSALSQRAVYYEPEGLEYKNIENIIYERQDKIDKIVRMCRDKSKRDEVLKEIGSTHHRYVVSFRQLPCLTNPIYENEAYSVYFLP